MRQYDYDTIITDIKFGTPALADELIKSFNETIVLANERLAAIDTEKRKKAEEELKRQQEEKAKQESKNSKVTK